MLTCLARRQAAPIRQPLHSPLYQSLFVLIYGSNVDWLKNVLAAGECYMQTRGRVVRLVEPQVIVDPELRLMPWPVGPVLAPLNRVT